MTAWTVGRSPADYVIGHVIAVLPDRIVDDARIVVRDGRVAEVGPHPAGAGCDLDGAGATLLPGLVDVHSDAFGKELRPRLGIALDPLFALAAAGARLRAAGVTTAFHGLAFQEQSLVGLPIGSPNALELTDVIASADDHYVDHQVLHRLDVRCRLGAELLERRLGAVKAAADQVVPVVSYEDHTPGMGQFADPATMRQWLVADEGMDEAEAADHIRAVAIRRDQRVDVRESTVARLGELAVRGRIRLFGHDLATPEEVFTLAENGCAVAEFPTTLQAARAAHERGLLVVAGAPNVVRGGSHSGNVAAAELAANGLVHALASDYLPAAMLVAAVRLVRDGIATLPQAVALVTSGPAACAGLHDRGELREGSRADLIIADLSRALPVVHVVLRAPH